MVWDPESLNDSALASVAMGYQVGVTPLQMAVAVSAVANGGQLVQPRAVRAVIRDNRRLLVPHKVLDRVVSASTMATLTEIMERVVVDGTGKLAKVEGYTVAGKTGTAKKLLNGSYRGHSDYNVSFIGFVPSRKPVFTIVVVVDSPHRVSPYGGVVAAPIFQKIATAALRQYGVPASINAPEPVLASRAEQADQVATSAAVTPASSLVQLTGAVAASVSQLPDLTGMSAREALRVLARLGCTVELRGGGLVVDQFPAPGTPLDSGMSVVLTLGRRPTDRVASVEAP
jgi:membrane peptidoglycan carboxypeptidase